MHRIRPFRRTARLTRQAKNRAGTVFRPRDLIGELGLGISDWICYQTTNPKSKITNPKSNKHRIGFEPMFSTWQAEVLAPRPTMQKLFIFKH